MATTLLWLLLISWLKEAFTSTVTQWVMSDTGQNCADACTDVCGSYSDETSLLDNDSCGTKITALGYNPGSLVQCANPIFQGLGCWYQPTYPRYDFCENYAPVTDVASLDGTQRVCACTVGCGYLGCANKPDSFDWDSLTADGINIPELYTAEDD
eukprot:445404_1